MSFIELNRYFVPITKNVEPNLEFLRFWERKAPGWLDWSDLRGHQRVVLLAEASSGKTAEFRNQAKALTTAGATAFCVRIEELADEGFEAALDVNDAAVFQKWRNGTSEGWFFLDSVDEARLNRKSFESALKRFNRDLAQSLEQARVFISCRVTDWKGTEDRDIIERLLPAWERPEDTSGTNDDYSTLLDPIFKPKSQDSTSWNAKPKREPKELLVVQIVPLSTDQCRILAAALGVTDVPSFIDAINRNGLDAFTERPGDIIDLVDYWRSYKCFDSFSKMMEHSIIQKLKESDAYRADNDTLPLNKARQGAERLAAGLTLGKSFTLRAPAYHSDPSLASGALDPELILTEWTDAERNALLRRGIFAPSTYGRIRFHHRSTQEYLTAQWMHRLLESNCPRPEIWNLNFADRYGVETIVPTLRAVGAWLGLRQPDILSEIVRREPLVLLQHGDPGALPLERKKQLLLNYAKKHAAGDIANDSIDRRALWMFADINLADAICEAWLLNNRDEFHADLLRVVREGKIAACAELARSLALDESANEFHRIIAVEAIKSCNDRDGLAAVAKFLVSQRKLATPRLASAFAKACFPDYLTIQNLVEVIADSQPAREYTVGGFPNELIDIYDLCPDKSSRAELVDGLAETCLAEPFTDRHHRVSARHSELARHLEPLAKRELESLGQGDPPDYLVRLLMTVERANREYRPQENWPILCSQVRSNPRLQRKLFWADVAELRTKAANDSELIRFWQIGFGVSPLWHFGLEDLPWLYDDLANRTVEADQRIALSAIIAILQKEGDLGSKKSELRDLIKSQPALCKDLAEYLVPVTDRFEDEQWKEERRVREQRIAEQEEHNKHSWISFRQDLQLNPGQLCDPQCLSSWNAGIFRLWQLTVWLQHRTGVNDHRSLRQWRLLKEGFGRDVAEAYRDGLMLLWRKTEPERPKRHKGAGYTVKFSTILSFGAIEVESIEDPQWNLKLTDDEAARAARHGTLSEQGYPEWIEALLNSHFQIVLPEIEQAVGKEWSTGSGIRSDFLSQYASATCLIPSPVQEILYRRFSTSEPREISGLDRALHIIIKLKLGETAKTQLLRITKRRFAKHAAAGRDDFALRNLGLMLVLDIDGAIDDLVTWIESTNGTDGQSRAQATLAFLFDRHNPILSAALGNATVSTLEKCLRLAYFYIRPEEDARHEGVYQPGLRDNSESARNFILKSILDRPGVEAYRLVRRSADEPDFAIQADQFKVLARGKAERDTEPPAWNEADTVSFEQRHVRPVKTGLDLLRLVTQILQDIQFQLTSGDVSSRPLLERAKDEDEVQKWLVEQLNFRSRGRFNAYREAEVAGGDKPDVVISSTTAQCEVGIEVKHGGMAWSPRQLEKALCQQLAEDYLKPSTRRHGVLVVTHHRQKRWRDPESNGPMTFDVLIKWLQLKAKMLIKNDSGPIEVRCIGIDALPPTARE